MPTEPNGELIPVGGGDTIRLIRPDLTIGRRESCDIRLPYSHVSGVHCQLNFADGHWTLSDLDSTNGIKVNDERVFSKVLHPGDVITIGKRKYTIAYEAIIGQHTHEDSAEDIMSQSLLEKAGLVHRRIDPLPTPKESTPDEPATP